MLLNNQKPASANKQKISEDIFVMGSVERKGISLEIYECLVDYLGYSPTQGEILEFKRLSKNDKTFHSTSYTRVFRRDSTVLSFLRDDQRSYGEIKMYFQFNEDESCHTLALVEPFSVLKDDSQLVIVRSEKAKCLCVPVTSILNKLVFINHEDNIHFLVHLPRDYICS